MIPATKNSLEFTNTYKNKQVTAHLSVIIFEDDNCTVAYCPALNLYGYGADENCAKSSFEISLNEYFRYTLNKGTLIEDLLALGWKKKGKYGINPPIFSSLLRTNKDFREIFNTREFHKIDKVVSLSVA